MLLFGLIEPMSGFVAHAGLTYFRSDVTVWVDFVKRDGK